MATQAALIMDTITGMKRALSRQDSSSDSDDYFNGSTNRGNKLRKRARHARQGKLGRSHTLNPLKRKLEYNGYYRHILARNPKRYDEDGYELDEDEEETEIDALTAESNPYSEIHLEDLLRPLTSAASLPTHPSMAVPYVSPVLSNMTQMASEMVQHEKQVIAEPKLLLAQLRGDDNWIPCGALDSEMDKEIFGTERIYCQLVQTEPSYGYGGHVDSTPDDASSSLALNSMPHARPRTQISEHWVSQKTEGHTPKLPSTAQIKPSTETSPGSQPTLELNKSETSSDPTKETTKGNGEKPLDLENIHAQVIEGRSPGPYQKTRTQSPIEVTSRNTPQRADLEPTAAGRTSRNPEDAISDVGTLRGVNVKNLIIFDDSIGGASKAQEADKARHDVAEQPKPIANLGEDGDVIMVEGDEQQPNGNNEASPVIHRMTTRGKAQVASDKTTSSQTRSVSPVGSTVPAIHPLFLMPESVGPDRDFGLPKDEAEATRRILMSYVQKQEEVCRGTEKLYNGLLKADRMRKTVFEWCKAEGHLGEMSDGEDWYDKEEWGLEEDLRKGHDDEEDEAVTQHKKTRGRRA